MPEKKGRKRRQRERRHAEPAEPRSASAPLPTQNGAATRRPPSEDLPKLRVRMAGFVLALLTLFIGILTAAQGISGGAGGVGSMLTFATGVALVLLAIVIGALTLAPERVRALLSRK